MIKKLILLDFFFRKAVASRWQAIKVDSPQRTDNLNDIFMFKMMIDQFLIIGPRFWRELQGLSRCRVAD